LLDFVGNFEAPEDADAVVVEAEFGGEAVGDSGRRAVVEGGSGVLRGLLEAEAITVAETAVEFCAGVEVLQAEVAAVRTCFQS